MKYITMSNKKMVMVDDDVFNDLNSMKWQECGDGYAGTTIWLGDDCMPRQKTLYMHRIIMGVNDARFHVDHINHNRLDNRRSNMRVATRNQNYVNQPVRKRNRLGVKGVSKVGNRYIAQMTVNKKHIFLGSFDSPEAASKKFQEQARHIWGDFAYSSK